MVDGVKSAPRAQVRISAPLALEPLTVGYDGKYDEQHTNTKVGKYYKQGDADGQLEDKRDT